MKLFVANCSKMNCVLSYRLPEIKNALAQNVDSGMQVIVAKPDLNTPQIDSFLDQIRILGGYVVEEISMVPEDVIIYWVTSLEKAVSLKKLEEVFLHNDIAMTKRGIETRKAAALAINNNFASRTPHAAGTMEVTIQEESPTNSNAFGQPLVAEGYRIDRTPGDIGGR
jgi:hypothetical protein